ncbi:MAG TPA: CaiB/BaiF CoA-transferase family protein [Kofleriaceae bacterium]|nr:CaiB/BaiF CoA-transferase family protein [Kofleriaceae bacterium]
MSTSPLAEALRGIRVLDLSRLLPGPYLTMVLADMGADVVKIEDPRVGDYLRAFPPAKGGIAGRFLAINRGKRSCALDLKAPAARDAFLQMVEKADVVVESFRPGVMDKLGLSYETLAARNPKIVVCSISGFGQTGPYKDKAGHDLNYIALSGVLAMTGPAGAAPQMPGIQIADLAGGALWSATSILAALVGRDRTGKGAHLDISMTEGSLALLAAELGNMDCGAKPTRGTETLNGALACYGVYKTKDARYLSVGALEPKFWIALNQAIGRPPAVHELVGKPADQAKFRGELQAIFETKTAAEWTAFFADKDCLVEVVLELDELQSHPLHQARDVFFEIDGGPGVGKVLQVRTPVGTPSHASAPPRLGEHTRDVLREYGLSEAQITSLAAQ